jgi:hypothetical protein
MSSCATQTFTGISQSRFDCLVSKAKAAGITIAGNVGEASKDGITISWLYDPGQETLALQCTSAPFFLSCGAINGKIHDLVDECP